MGTCCSEPKSIKGYKINCTFQDEIKTLHSLPSYQEIHKKILETFPVLQTLPFAIYLNDREIRSSTNITVILKNTKHVKLTAIRLYDVEFDASNPMSEVMLNVVKIYKNQSLAATGVYISDQFLITTSQWFTSPNDLKQGTTLFFAH